MKIIIGKYEIDLDKLVEAGMARVLDDGAAPVLVPLKPKRPAPKANWVAAALKIWEQKWGVGSANGLGFGRVGQAMKRLVEAHGETSVLLAWTRYVAEERDQFQSPEAFVRRFSMYSSRPEAPRQKSVRELLAEQADQEAVAGLK